ncbi:MAG: hypothetical protein QXU87_05110 [Candidatus Caldarchaeum sp.]
MEVSVEEWVLLTQLVERKKRASRVSVLEIPETGIRTYTGAVISPNVVLDLLKSLEGKGLIKLVNVVKKESTSNEPRRLVTEIVRLNTSYIAQHIGGKEYEKRFKDIVRRHASEISGKRLTLMPLTHVQRLIEIVRFLDGLVEFEKELIEFAGYLNPDGFGTARVADRVVQMLRDYLRGVEDIVTEHGESATVTLALLYPFIADQVTLKLDKAATQDVEALKKEIAIEKEIIWALQRLNADDKSIAKHQSRLLELEKKLQSYGKLILKITPNTQQGLADKTPLTSDVSDLFNYLVQQGEMVIGPEEDGHDALTELKAEIWLTWLNDECHVMQDSVIESGGEDLTLCTNRRCLIAYHKECLNILKKSGNPYCVACGAKLG